MSSPARPDRQEARRRAWTGECRTCGARFRGRRRLEHARGPRARLRAINSAHTRDARGERRGAVPRPGVAAVARTARAAVEATRCGGDAGAARFGAEDATRRALQSPARGGKTAVGRPRVARGRRRRGSLLESSRRSSTLRMIESSNLLIRHRFPTSVLLSRTMRYSMKSCGGRRATPAPTWRC